MSKLDDVILRGDRASQPAAAAVSPAALYYVTDEEVLERSTGAAWESYSGAGGGGGGDLVLLEQQTASASATLDFVSWYSAAYDRYVIDFASLLPTVDVGNGQLQVSTDGGSTWKTTGYEYAIKYQSPAGGSGVVNSVVDTSMFLLNNVKNITDGMSGSLKLYNPGGALSKLFQGDVGGLENDGNRYWFEGAWWYVSADPIDGIRFKYHNGSIASGSMSISGLTAA